MTDRKKRVFNWNHLSDQLTDEQIIELKSYYLTYHKKCWTYKQALKKFKKLRFVGNSLSLLFASGGIATSVATGGIAIVSVSTVALLIQGWMQHKQLDFKIQNCEYAYQSYQHLLNELKEIMRSGNFNSPHIYNTMKNIDDFIADNSPIVDKYEVKYDKKFNCEL